MDDKNVTDAAWTLLTSFQEANRIVAEHLMAAQAHNQKLVDGFFDSNKIVEEAHTVGIRHHWNGVPPLFLSS